jgi:hypothetical protein
MSSSRELIDRLATLNEAQERNCDDLEREVGASVAGGLLRPQRLM